MHNLDRGRGAPSQGVFNGHAGTPLSLEHALQQIASWPDLSATRRRDLMSDLRAFDQVCEIADGLKAQSAGRSEAGFSRAQVTLHCAYLRPRLFCRTPAAFGLRPARYATILSSLRFVLRRLAAMRPTGAARGTCSQSGSSYGRRSPLTTSTAA